MNGRKDALNPTLIVVSCPLSPFFFPFHKDARESIIPLHHQVESVNPHPNFSQPLPYQSDAVGGYPDPSTPKQKSLQAS